MKPFSEWPTDGLVTLILIIIGLIAIFVAPFLKSKNRNDFENGSYHLRIGTGGKIFAGILLLFSGIITYGISQSGYCPRMTVSENNQNTLMGAILALAFWLMTLYFFYAIFFVKRLFDKTKIVVSSPFKTTQYLWADLKSLGCNYNGNFIEFLGNRKIYLPEGLSSIEKMNAVMDARFLNIDNPLDPIQDDQDMTDKTIYIAIYRLNEELQAVVTDQFLGKVTQLNNKINNKISVQKENGDIIEVPANARSLVYLEDTEGLEMEMWNIQIPKDKHVDFVGVYYLTDDK